MACIFGWRCWRQCLARRSKQRLIGDSHTGRRSLAALLICLSLLLAPFAGWRAPAQAAQPAAPAAQAVANSDEEIVYLEPGGVIRVQDPNQAGDNPEVRWFSPTGGWVGFALSDVNLDGDAEIVAIGNINGVGKLTIFDPVASESEAGNGGFINGIPWRVLFDKTLLGIPRLVATGELDTTAPGDEIVVNYGLPPDAVVEPGDVFRFEGLVQSGPARDGRSWNVRALVDTGNLWTWVGLGDLNGGGVDEIALIDDHGGNLSVLALTNDGTDRIYRNTSQDNAWQHGAMGQWVGGGRDELFVVRETSYPLSSFFVLGVIDSNWVDIFHEYNDPPPSFVFTADITGNGDQEAVLLREVPVELGNRSRLFIRDNGNDQIVLTDDLLDADNGYLAGAGGDVDGDGRDEVVIMRGNRLRIFTEPESSRAVQDFAAVTDGRTIAIANLDAGGSNELSRLGATPDSIQDTVIAGAEQRVYGIAVHELSGNRVAAYSARIENSSPWVSLNPAAGNTPDTIMVTLTSQGLAAGTYEDRLLIETTDPTVVESAVAVPIQLTVLAGASTAPNRVDDVVYPCAEDAAPVSTELAITGTVGASYTVSFSPTVPWLSAAPLRGTVPATITVTVDPNATAETSVGTYLVVSAQDVGGAPSFTPIHLLCANERILMPTVQNR